MAYEYEEITDLGGVGVARNIKQMDKNLALSFFTILSLDLAHRPVFQINKTQARKWMGQNQKMDGSHLVGW